MCDDRNFGPRMMHGCIPINPRDIAKMKRMAHHFMRDFMGGYIHHNIEDLGNVYLITVPLPGRTKEDVKVSLINKHLNVTASKPKVPEREKSKEKSEKQGFPFAFRGFTFTDVNMAFKYVIKHKAKLLGTQGNKYYLDRNGEPVIDTGSFVWMIANAANVTPKIFGKPSKEYFVQALKRLDLLAKNTVVIGDDIESDIEGALNANIRGILVKTGKGQFYQPSKARIKPDLVIE
ncbi:unnamed protein product, partial [marine sediment metagenome]